jgi:hypothetical protein
MQVAEAGVYFSRILTTRGCAFQFLYGFIHAARSRELKSGREGGALRRTLRLRGDRSISSHQPFDQLIIYKENVFVVWRHGPVAISLILGP